MPAMTSRKLAGVVLLGSTLLLTAGFVAFGSGCNTDAAVFVTPTVETPSLTVSKTTNGLGTQLDGSLFLRLHLGARASGPSQVTLTAINVTNDVGSGDYVDNIPYTTDQSSPIDVEEDSDVNVKITLSTGASLQPLALYDTICKGGKVVITGIFNDSLQDTGTKFTSDSFAPTCM